MYRVELVLLIIVCQNGLDVVAVNGYSPLYDLHRVVYTSVAHSPLEHALLHRLTLHLQVNNQLHWHHLYNVSMCNIRQVFTKYIIEVISQPECKLPQSRIFELVQSLQDNPG